MLLRVRRGLRCPQAAPPGRMLAPDIHRVAVSGDDHPDLKPSLRVAVGSRVCAGDTVFTDRNDPAIRFVSPVDGRVSEIRRGPRRRLRFVVVETAGGPVASPEIGPPLSGIDALFQVSTDTLRERLQRAGLWPGIRQRPGDGLAPSNGRADVVLVTVIDTEPWALDPALLLEGRWAAFWLGVAALSRFARHTTWVCASPRFQAPPAELGGQVRVAEFSGSHPAGLAGTHLGRLAPLSAGRTAWIVNSEDAAAIGETLLSGRLAATRHIGFVGPGVDQSAILQLPLGACVSDLGFSENVCLVSGSVLAGRPAVAPFEFLGRFHRQVTAWPSNRRDVRGLARGLKLAPFWPGGARPPAAGMLARDVLDRHWGLGGLPAPLLRALMTGDLDRAVALGCLDLGEEDLAIATALCAGGHDYGAYLRQALDELRPERAS